MSQRFPSAQPYANRPDGLRLVWPGKEHDRHIEIGKGKAIALGAAVLLLSGWYLVATCYLIFRDEMLAGLIRSQSEMQYAYEDRIASLRAHIDRVASRQIVDQDSFEGRLSELMARQAQLETRSAVISNLANKAAEQGIAVETADAAPAVEQAAEPRRPAKPVPEGMELQQRSDLGPVYGAMAFGPLRMDNGVGARDSVASQIETVGASLGMIETEQLTALKRLERTLGEEPARLKAVLDATGLEPSRFAKRGNAKTDKDGVGGPLIPLDGMPEEFNSQVAKIERAIREHAVYSQAISAIPLRRPVPRGVAITSGFGPRNDPFLARSAMHSGIDFRGDVGDPARATAPGRVVDVGWNGGYGKMVEIDHGYGIATRYAHLSAFDVEPGDIVARGQIIGRIGSTGRSTGPHLHYEVRVDGEAVDPMRFLRAASRLP